MSDTSQMIDCDMSHPHVGWIVELQKPAFGYNAGMTGRIILVQEHTVEMEILLDHPTWNRVKMFVDNRSFASFFERLRCRTCEQYATRVYFDIPVCDSQTCYEVALDTVADRD